MPETPAPLPTGRAGLSPSQLIRRQRNRIPNSTKLTSRELERWLLDAGFATRNGARLVATAKAIEIGHYLP